MELQLMMFVLVELCLLLCGFMLQESTGISLPTSLASLFRPIEPSHSDPPAYHPSSTIPSDPWKFNISSNAYAPSSPYHVPSARKGTHKHRHFRRNEYHIAPQPSSHGSKGPSSRAHIRKPLPAAIPSGRLYVPSPSPAMETPPPLPSLVLPPPPPQKGCAPLTCTGPLTYTPPGSPCGCVFPIEVKLLFSVSIFTFFRLVPELAAELAEAIPLNHSQVRIIGADQQVEKTAVLVKLVPLEDTFKDETALSIYNKFWNRSISLNTSIFGLYEVLYVHYPGLPNSPPSRSSGSATIDVPQYPAGTGNDEGPLKPFGVNVPRKRKNESGNKTTVIIVVLSSVTAFVVCMGFLFLVLLKCSSCSYGQSQRSVMSPDRKLSGGGRKLLSLRSRPSSASMSFSSSLLACTGTAKIFTIEDIEIATNNFDSSRILGEGGFGLVYGGILDDGRNVAVKVLKRDDSQGGREFLAEVEMLGRLHHRNLVKMIGICAEDYCRCLVYELVPNGSVESHLHDKESFIVPLNWSARMKIALGAARGLAYLHEDSSPRVIHRDFKSSNILLEDDYTPKVSDFGLARAAIDEGSKQISTHVMGTFGYLAPEYAMTRHLLVKSDVYSYGVVLLELLTGRKPVDLSQPPGQENLVSWARPLLASEQGLEAAIDPYLKPNVPLENFSKVAAIASMCVQPEVAHRPFMGEVVQALKLVCHEFEEAAGPISRSFSQDEFYGDVESKQSGVLSGELMEALGKCGSSFDSRVGLSSLDLKISSGGFEGKESGSFRRQFNSAPLKMVERPRTFWQRLRVLSGGSMSDHEHLTKL